MAQRVWGWRREPSSSSSGSTQEISDCSPSRPTGSALGWETSAFRPNCRQPLPAAVEADDLVAALYAAANFADARASRALWMVRRALGGAAGGLEICAAWRTGGVEVREGRMVHRRDLAWAESGRVLVCGSYAAAGTGNMWASAPPFGVPEEEGRWPWEEAGLLERLAMLHPPEG